jgi:hypothetical protein
MAVVRHVTGVRSFHPRRALPLAAVFITVSSSFSQKTPLVPAAAEPIAVQAWTSPDGLPQLGDRDLLTRHSGKPQTGIPVFRLAASEDWPAGLVPLFPVETAERVELRRRPPRGTEDSTQPLGFALPAETDHTAQKLAGTWRCLATRSGSSDSWFVWQLATEGHEVFGRFDPGTEFRVAYFKGGTFRTNHLAVTVEYTSGVYRLTGTWQAGKLRGTWEREDREEHGTWEGTRDETLKAIRPSTSPVPLLEWRHPAHRWSHWTITTNSPAPGWTNYQQSLGLRVWPPVEPR